MMKKKKKKMGAGIERNGVRFELSIGGLGELGEGEKGGLKV